MLSVVHPAVDNFIKHLMIPHSQIAFLKSYSTSCGQETARDAVQIFGGRGITRTGMGKYIEHVREPFHVEIINLTPIQSIIVPSLSTHFSEARKMS
jgi:alkylation response protein AidB-like acyl-CoA dehydrogenase